MIIYNKQLIPFGKKITKEFIAEQTQSIPSYYKEWAASKDENEIKKMVTEVVEFAVKNNIKETQSFSDLINFQIKFNVMDDFENDERYKKVIENKSLNESKRIAQVRDLIVEKLKKSKLWQ